jgi:hypothetical protein
MIDDRQMRFVKALNAAALDQCTERQFARIDQNGQEGLKGCCPCATRGKRPDRQLVRKGGKRGMWRQKLFSLRHFCQG